MRLFYCDHFELPLPAGHRFPMKKYALLRQAVLDLGVAAVGNLHVPVAVSDEEIERAHDPAYVHRVVRGELSRQEIRRIGFPWSPALVERSRRSAGGTVAACRAAMDDGVSANLAGGTHHAARACGEGFCVFNDSAIAARALQAEGRVARVAVVDCDVHQGNGTAEIFEDDPSVFTVSVHAANNFPFCKHRSDVDIELEDGARDDAYLVAVERAVRAALAAPLPDLLIYVSGADPLDRDRLGRLSVTPGALEMRDRLVFAEARGVRVPVAVSMAGGYAPDVGDTVAVHVATVREAARSAATWTANHVSHQP